nr:MAG: polyprotein 1 [Picornavirales sp.]
MVANKRITCPGVNLLSRVAEPLQKGAPPTCLNTSVLSGPFRRPGGVNPETVPTALNRLQIENDNTIELESPWSVSSQASSENDLLISDIDDQISSLVLDTDNICMRKNKNKNFRRLRNLLTCYKKYEKPIKNKKYYEEINRPPQAELFSSFVINSELEKHDLVVILGMHIPSIMYSRNTAELFCNCIKLIDAIRGRPILTDKKIWKFVMQYFHKIMEWDESIEGLEQFTELGRDYLDKYDSIKDSPFFQKLYRLLMFCLTYSVFDKFNITFDSLGYTKLESEAIKCKFLKRHDFMRSLLDTFIFILERGVQIMKTGEISPLFHSGTTYEKWYEDFLDLTKKYPFINNPEEHGFTECEFLSNLDIAIERGESMRKYATKTGQSNNFLNMHLAELIRMQSSLLTRVQASKSRDPPYSILICGNSGIGKSSIKDMIFHFYGKLMGLPTSDEYKYTRTFGEEYWNNFKSSSWAIILDDVGFMNPKCAQGGDTSVMEFLQIINAVPFSPPQASLEDKGKTPMRAKLVIATTNTRDMNTQHYFSFPTAAQRRFPYIVEPKLRPEYTDKRGMLDSDLAKNYTGTFPDFWTWNIVRVDPVSIESKSKMANYINVHENLDLKDFLLWLRDNIESFQENLKSMKSSNDRVCDAVYCNFCKLPRDLCDCPIDLGVQSNIISDSDFDDTPSIGFSENTSDDEFEEVPLEDEVIVETESKIGEIPKISSFNLLNLFCTVFYTYYSTVYDACIQLQLYDWNTFHQTVDRILLRFPRLGIVITDLLSVLRCRWIYPYVTAVGYSITCQPYILLCRGFIRLHKFSVYLYTRYLKRLNISARIKEYLDRFDKRVRDFLISPGLLQRITLFPLNTVRFLVSRYFFSRDLRHIVEYYDLCPFTVIYIVLYHKVYTRREIELNLYSRLGTKVQKSICYIPYLVALAIAIKSCKMIYNVYTRFSAPRSKNEPQGSVEDGNVPKPDGEKKNPWVKEDFITTPFDIGSLSQGWSNLSLKTVTEQIGKNVFRMVSYSDIGGKSTGIFAITDQWYVANCHGICFQADNSIICSIIRHPTSSRVSRNLAIKISPSNIIIDETHDCVFFKIINLPPNKNLLNLFPNATYKARGNGVMISRTANGELITNDVSKLERLQPAIFKHLKGEPLIERYGAFGMQRKTELGDCGSPYILQSPLGPVIVGIHVSGENGISDVIFLSRTYVEAFIKEPYIFGSGEIEISAPSAQRTVTDLAIKAPIRYIDKGVADVYGSFNGFRGKRKSMVENSPLNPILTSHGYKTKYTAPDVSSWKPWNLALQDMTNPVTNIDELILKQVKESFCKDLIEGLSTEELNKLEPYDLFTAVNGAAGVTYVDRMKRTTSAGCPWKKCKKYFLIDDLPRGDNLEPVKLNDEMYGEVERLTTIYESGERCNPNFCASLKDEPVTFAKREIGKTRVFSGAPMPWVVVVRKYLLSFIRVAQRNKYLFEAAPGMNAASPEWTELYKYLTDFGEERIVAGDYKAYDKRMSPQFILAAFDIISTLCSLSGNYTSSDLKCVRGIALDTAFPVTDFNGDLIQFYGSNPSGHPLTVTINSLVNCLYMRYAYQILNPDREVRSFKENVHLMTYGDDNILGTKVDWFNHTNIQQIFEQMDIVYTMANKTDASVPFIHIKNATFLKRSWLFSEEIGYYMCPLENESIERSLMVWVKSKSVTWQEQIVDVVRSAVGEYFFYGRKTFNKRRDLLMDAVKKLNIELWVKDSTFPTFDELASDIYLKDK